MSSNSSRTLFSYSSQAMTSPYYSRGSKIRFKIFIFALFLLLAFAIIAGVYIENKHQKKNPTLMSVIVSACKATTNPDSCRSSLLDSGILPSRPSSLDVIQSAVALCSEKASAVETNLESIISSTSNQNISRIAKLCLEFVCYSQRRMSLVNESIRTDHIKTARAWLSASLSYVADCSRGFKFYTSDTSSIADTMTMLSTLENDVESTLSMLVAYDLHGNDTTLWNPPRTERDGFWEIPNEGNATNFEARFPSNLPVNAIVCKDTTSGCFATVQEAVDAVPPNSLGERFVIQIKKGVYEEIIRIPFDKKNVVFVGDGMNKTVISGSRSVSQPGITTYDSATVGVVGDGFMATNITFRNTAGPAGLQAVAFRSCSDKSIIYNCEFVGNQDTLYAHSLRQYYKSCKIQGSIDFIFGNAAAVFENCWIRIASSGDNLSKSTNVICASGRIHPSQSTGFIFNNCTINSTDQYVGDSLKKAYLGRPWKEYARTVYINCEVGAVISPEGWMTWDGDYALSTLYYGEFGNLGAGSNFSGRVPWSSIIPAQNISAYSVQNFIQGNEWLTKL